MKTFKRRASGAVQQTQAPPDEREANSPAGSAKDAPMPQHAKPAPSAQAANRNTPQHGKLSPQKRAAADDGARGGKVRPRTLFENPGKVEEEEGEKKGKASPLVVDKDADAAGTSDPFTFPSESPEKEAPTQRRVSAKPVLPPPPTTRSQSPGPSAPLLPAPAVRSRSSSPSLPTNPPKQFAPSPLRRTQLGLRVSQPVLPTAAGKPLEQGPAAPPQAADEQQAAPMDLDAPAELPPTDQPMQPALPASGSAPKPSAARARRGRQAAGEAAGDLPPSPIRNTRSSQQPQPPPQQPGSTNATQPPSLPTAAGTSASAQPATAALPRAPPQPLARSTEVVDLDPAGSGPVPMVINLCDDPPTASQPAPTAAASRAAAARTRPPAASAPRSNAAALLPRSGAPILPPRGAAGGPLPPVAALSLQQQQPRKEPAITAAPVARSRVRFANEGPPSGGNGGGAAAIAAAAAADVPTASQQPAGPSSQPVPAAAPVAAGGDGRQAAGVMAGGMLGMRQATLGGWAVPAGRTGSGGQRKAQIQSVAEAQENGEALALQDEAMYALDGLRPGAVRRESLVQLAELLATRRGRAALRVDDLAQQVVTRASCLPEVASDPALSLSAAAVLLALSVPDAHAAYLASEPAMLLAMQLMQAGDLPSGSESSAPNFLTALKNMFDEQLLQRAHKVVKEGTLGRHATSLLGHAGTPLRRVCPLVLLSLLAATTTDAYRIQYTEQVKQLMRKVGLLGTLAQSVCQHCHDVRTILLPPITSQPPPPRHPSQPPPHQQQPGDSTNPPLQGRGSGAAPPAASSQGPSQQPAAGSDPSLPGRRSGPPPSQGLATKQEPNQGPSQQAGGSGSSSAPQAAIHGPGPPLPAAGSGPAQPAAQQGAGGGVGGQADGSGTAAVQGAGSSALQGSSAPQGSSGPKDKDGASEGSGRGGVQLAGCGVQLAGGGVQLAGCGVQLAGGGVQLAGCGYLDEEACGRLLGALVELRLMLQVLENATFTCEENERELLTCQVQLPCPSPDGPIPTPRPSQGFLESVLQCTALITLIYIACFDPHDPHAPTWGNGGTATQPGAGLNPTAAGAGVQGTGAVEVKSEKGSEMREKVKAGCGDVLHAAFSVLMNLTHNHAEARDRVVAAGGAGQVLQLVAWCSAAAPKLPQAGGVSCAAETAAVPRSLRFSSQPEMEEPAAAGASGAPSGGGAGGGRARSLRFSSQPEPLVTAGGPWMDSQPSGEEGVAPVGAGGLQHVAHVVQVSRQHVIRHMELLTVGLGLLINTTSTSAPARQALRSVKVRCGGRADGQAGSSAALRAWPAGGGGGADWQAGPMCRAVQLLCGMLTAVMPAAEADAGPSHPTGVSAGPAAGAAAAPLAGGSISGAGGSPARQPQPTAAAAAGAGGTSPGPAPPPAKQFTRGGRGGNRSGGVPAVQVGVQGSLPAGAEAAAGPSSSSCPKQDTPMPVGDAPVPGAAAMAVDAPAGVGGGDGDGRSAAVMMQCEGPAAAMQPATSAPTGTTAPGPGEGCPAAQPGAVEPQQQAGGSAKTGKTGAAVVPSQPRPSRRGPVGQDVYMMDEDEEEEEGEEEHHDDVVTEGQLQGQRDEGEASIIQVYASMLLGFLIQDCAIAQRAARRLLPGGNLGPLVDSIGHMLQFYMQADAITDNSRDALLQLLQVLGPLVAADAAAAAAAGSGG